MKSLFVLSITSCVLAALLGGPAFADSDGATSATQRLMIVDGNSDQVIYDDGRDDLFCVTRMHRWHDQEGYLHHRRSMRCR